MRRHPKRFIDNLARHLSFFKWFECIKCGLEFRRERGFKTIIGPYHGGQGNSVYLCGTCCRSIGEANDYFKTVDQTLPLKGSLPPPPPRPVSGKRPKTVEYVENNID